MKIRAPVKEYDPIKIEKRINDFWVRTYAYTRDKNSRAKQKKYYFVDGPPFTAGSINIGLARNKIIKDAHIRFIKSQGFNVMDRPGFDMHGLPIEVKVEDSLGLKFKNQIEELGVEKFVKCCMEFADAHRNTMTEQFRSLGIWLDWQNPYLTADSRYIESVWWSLKEAHRKGLLVRQKQVTGWCPRCESPLAPGEIFYKPTEGHSVYFKIPIKGKRDEYIIVWTTTPWTFAGCLAIAVNPDLTYAKVAVRQGGKKSTIIVLEDRVEEIALESGIEAYEITDTFKGKSLEKLGFFHPLMADIKFHKSADGEWCHKILALDSVHDSHTGCVYIAPGLGMADAEIGSRYSLPIFSPVDERGVFTTEVGMKYAGQTTDEANASVVADMKALRFVLSSSRHEHRFGRCWRCDSPVISRATEQWFLKSGEAKEAMQKIVRGVSWTPESFGSKRQQEWISKGHDWCISRQRFWGTPLPIWECIADICGHIEVVGSLRELEGANGYSDGMDLHRPWIDAVSIECPKCGGIMKRVPDIVDVWFDSGAASWAQLGYPRKKAQFREMWPADWIAESQDQSKGWFYNQIFEGAVLFGKIPFRKVLAHGHLFSESSAGISDISAATDIYGTDAFRFYMLGLDPTESVNFTPVSIKKYNSVLRILWNCYTFSASYMNMDAWDPRENQLSKVRGTLRQEDVWIISRAESLTHAVRKEMDAMRTHNACTLIEEFIVRDLSRWYVKLSRERMWKEGLTPDKEAAFTVQREILTRLSVLLWPIAPFMAETIYQEMDGNLLSVSMVPWPEPDGIRLAEGMEKSMDRAREIVETAQRFRQELGLGLRWPISKMTISAKSQAYAESVATYSDIIKSQSNVKELELVPENQEWAGQELLVVPNRNVIGKAYKQRLSKIARMLKVLPAKEIKEKILAGEYELGIEGEMIKILPDMVRFETKLPEGIESKEFAGGTLYFDTKMTDELMAEGFAREIIRRIQQMRKEAGLDPEEYITLRIKLDSALLDLLDKWLEVIADSTRATQMEVVDSVSEDEYIVEWPIQEETVVIGITSLNIRKAMGEFMGQKDIDSVLALAMVEAGMLTAQDFLQADREEVLKIPGMSHSKYRKLKEYLELPAEKRKLADSVCPLCNGHVEQGSTSCHRCGKDLISGEELAVEIIRDLEAEEEPEYVQEPVREKVRVGKKRPQPEEEVQPEDEVVRMASETASDEDEITSEILSGIGGTEAETSPANRIPEPLRTPEAERKPEPAPPNLISSEIPAETPAAETAPDRPREREELPGKASEPERGQTSQEQASADRFFAGEAAEHAQPPMPHKPREAEAREPDEYDIEDTFIREMEGPEEPESPNKDEIIDEGRDREIRRIAEAFDIKNSAAKTLYNHGFTSVESFSAVTEDQLREIKGIGKITARRIVQKSSKDETKMCSLCNAIVPTNASVCIRCGQSFASAAGIHAADEPISPDVGEAEGEGEHGKPSDSALLYSKAHTLKDAGKYREALDVTNIALNTSPEDGRLIELKQELEEDVRRTRAEASVPESGQRKERSLTFAEARKLKEALERSEVRRDVPQKDVGTGAEGQCLTDSEAEDMPNPVRTEASRARQREDRAGIMDVSDIQPEEPESAAAHEAGGHPVRFGETEDAESPDRSGREQQGKDTDVSVQIHMQSQSSGVGAPKRDEQEPSSRPGLTPAQQAPPVEEIGQKARPEQPEEAEAASRSQDTMSESRESSAVQEETSTGGERETAERNAAEGSAAQEPVRYIPGPAVIIRDAKRERAGPEPAKEPTATEPMRRPAPQEPAHSTDSEIRTHSDMPGTAKAAVGTEGSMDIARQTELPEQTESRAPKTPEEHLEPRLAADREETLAARPDTHLKARETARTREPEELQYEAEELLSESEELPESDGEPPSAGPTEAAAYVKPAEPRQAEVSASPTDSEEPEPGASQTSEGKRTTEAPEPDRDARHEPAFTMKNVQEVRVISEAKPPEATKALQHGPQAPPGKESVSRGSAESRGEERWQPIPVAQAAFPQIAQSQEVRERSVDVARETRYEGSQPPVQPQTVTAAPSFIAVGAIPPEPRPEGHTEEPEGVELQMPAQEASAEAAEPGQIMTLNESLSTLHEDPAEVKALQMAAKASYAPPGETAPDGEAGEIYAGGGAESDSAEPSNQADAIIVEAIGPDIEPEAHDLKETRPETVPEKAPVGFEATDSGAGLEASILKDVIQAATVSAKEIEDPDGVYQNGEVKLRSSFTYLIPEERSARSYQLFKKSIAGGKKGYCVTRTFPEKVRERYELGDIPILWLSNVAKEEAVRPKDLEKLSLSLEEFLGEEGGVILLDGIEYLITNNNFITVLKLIQSLRDQVAINRSILLLSINPSTMDSHQINLLKREVDSVIE